MKSSAGDVDVELLKAVAQAWYAHSGNPRPSSRAASADDEGGGVCVRRAGAQRYRPTRFKLEAAAAAAAAQRSRSWDFAQSLWDTYELVSVAQRIESSLAIIDEAAAAPPPPRAVADEGAARGAGGGGGKRPRDGRRSLKSLFHRSSPRRFEESSR
uniref:Uncharacterized protein n=1 Tax=Avena sativa TaxID=4498 RepID=A0ACD5YTT5_AVESA